MKQLLFLALSAILCICPANAQNDEEFEDFLVNRRTTLVDDSISVDSPEQSMSPQIGTTNSMFDVVQNFAPIGNGVMPKEQTYPLGRGLFKKHHLEQALEICPNISRSKVNQSELLSGQNLEDVEDTGLGLNFGYSLIFIPGHEENGKLRLNKAGFAYNIGFLASFTSSDRYGTLCDFMAKVGFETCHNKKMGIGFDFLYGYGKSQGDVFWYNNIVEDSEPISTTPYTSWGMKYGGQIWLKTGLFGNSSLLSNTDVLLFARLIKAPDPEVMTKVSVLSYNLWKGENWSFGVILRYRM